MIKLGVGFGLAYTAAIVAIGEHFFKYRSLAFGLSLAGGSVGNMAFPWISTTLINHFGWRGMYFFFKKIDLWSELASILKAVRTLNNLPDVKEQLNQRIV